ncbi:MAG: exosortase A-associated hydrolase 2 [Motiliproteus sp.]|jgi:exosortase A-associated hydrolase 2
MRESPDVQGLPLPQPPYQGHFIEGSLGRLYLGCFGRLPAQRVLLYLPPFAEEMNLSRAVVSRQAYALANRGWTVVTLDFYGTGDSAGELVEVAVCSWLADIDRALCWLKSQGAAEVSLWGLRLGALLAYRYLETRPEAPVQQLVLWEPVLDPQRMLKQLFRIKQISDSRLQGRAQQTDGLARTLDGELTVVAGYPISPRLARSLVQLSWDNERLFEYCGVMIQITSGFQGVAHPLFSAANTPTLRLSHCQARPFWQVPEVYDAPELIEMTLNFLGAHA